MRLLKLCNPEDWDILILDKYSMATDALLSWEARTSAAIVLLQKHYVIRTRRIDLR